MPEWAAAGIIFVLTFTIILWDIYSKHRNAPPSQDTKRAGDHRDTTNGQEENAASDRTDNRGWHPQEQHHRRVERRYWSRQNIVSAITLIFSLVAVGASGASAFFAWGAMKAARDQVATARETEAHQLRAYVYTVITNAIPSLVVGAENFFSVNFINGGATPAYEPIGELSWGVVELPLTKPIEQYSQQHTTFLTGPPGFYLFKDRTSPLSSNSALVLHEEQIAAIRNNQAVIYFLGRITYRDIFGCHRHTAFCTYYAMTAGRIVPRDCPSYNDVDNPNICERN
jgi:hypothetical protein